MDDSQQITVHNGFLNAQFQKLEMENNSLKHAALTILMCLSYLSQNIHYCSDCNVIISIIRSASPTEG